MKCAAACLPDMTNYDFDAWLISARHFYVYSREDVDCRKRPCEARECAKAHSFYKKKGSTACSSI